MKWYAELEMDVEYTYYPSQPAIINHRMGIYEPEEDENVEVLSVICNGKDISDCLTRNEWDDLYDACLEDAHENAQDDEDVAADYKYESQKEYREAA